MGSADMNIAIFDPSFRKVVGSNPQISVCLENSDIPLFHEAGVFIEETGELFVTSNQWECQDGKKNISISKINIVDGSYSCEVIFPDISMANGAVNYQDGILVCDQGNLTDPGGLVYMSARHPYQTEKIVSSFMGVPFNSVNDVVVAKDGAIWFTDPIYGYEQGIRPVPKLPAPNLSLQPQLEEYSSHGRRDTDHIHGDGNEDPTHASNIYAFDLVTIASQPFLTNRRLFAFTEARAPDGIKCDMEGNVYSGCRDGINVWSPGAVLLGKILIPGGVANFCFCRPGEIMALNEHRLWSVKLAPTTVGALLCKTPEQEQQQQDRA